MQQAILFSGLLHFILLLLMLFGLPNPFPNRIVQNEMAVVIEFAPVAKETKAPVLAPHDTAKQIDIDKPLEDIALPEEKVEPAKPEEVVEQKAAVEEKADVAPIEPKLPEKPLPPPEELKKEEPPASLPEIQKPVEQPSIDEDAFPLKDKKIEPKKEESKKEEPKKEDKKKIEPKKEIPLKDKKETPPTPLPLEKPKKKNKEGDKKAVVSLDNKDKKNVDSKKKDPKKKQETLDDLLVAPKDSKPKKQNQSVIGVNAQKTDIAFSTSEIAKLKAHIARCWHVHAGAKNAKEHIVDIDIHMTEEGFVEKADIVDKGRMASDPFYKVAAETAQRSLLDPSCNPLPIPKSDYKNWADITFRFDPKEMF
jgi:hypothetical protein